MQSLLNPADLCHKKEIKLQPLAHQKLPVCKPTRTNGATG